MADRTTKILLGLIALGLWANLAIPQIRPAHARETDSLLRMIDLNIGSIAFGTCVNRKLC